MTAFFVPRTGEITLSTGAKHVVVAGVREVDGAVVSDPAANAYGIKPVHEMSADERAQHGLPPAAPDVDESIRVEPEGDAPAPEDGKTRIVAALAAKPDA